MWKPALVAALTLITAGAALAKEGKVWRSPSCGCCEAWVQHMRANGFKLDLVDVPRSELNAKKQTLGVAGKFAACHTAEIGGYVIEGHVPAEDVVRLIEEKPDAVGLSVPGMPVGSPGMEADGAREPYDVLLVKKDGASEVFAHRGEGAPERKPD